MTREKLFKYIKEVYKVEPDTPFEGDFDSSVLRHKDTNKWFALVMKVNKNKLGYSEDKIVDILTIKSEPVLIDNLILRSGFHRAYHMNKTMWMSIEISEKELDSEIKNLIDMSFELTNKKNKIS